MKKNKIKVLIALMTQVLILSSCGSTDEVADAYEDEYSASSINISSEEKKVVTEKKEAGFWASFFGADKITEIDTTSLYTQNLIFSLEKHDADIVVHNKVKTAGFGTSYVAAYYYVTFDDTSRELFQLAVKKYIDDFENKKLDRKNNKSYKAYGSVKCRLDWGTFKISTPNNADANAYLGYKFDGKSPYFTITIYPAKNNKSDGTPNGTYPLESMILNYYFTKSMATDLINKLSTDAITEYFNKIEAKSDTAIERDEY